ncbi:MAG: hypothetical protein IT292_01865 [Deltaproteobacteria bacterium]|nr:hypothetical protein [Deltaproteobacteria bacterium]
MKISPETHHEPRIMIVESNINQRKLLMEAILSIGFTSDVYEANSVAEGQELLLSEPYDLCFVGAGLSENTQKTFIATMTKDHHLERCVFIPLCKRPSKEKVMEFIHAGANGVLVLPIAEDALKRVVEVAFHNKMRHKKVTNAAKEIDTLSKLVASLSERLCLLTKTLEEQNVDINLSTVSPKFVRELVLHSLLTLNDNPHEAIESLLNKLYRQL